MRLQGEIWATASISGVDEYGTLQQAKLAATASDADPFSRTLHRILGGVEAATAKRGMVAVSQAIQVKLGDDDILEGGCRGLRSETEAGSCDS